MFHIPIIYSIHSPTTFFRYTLLVLSVVCEQEKKKSWLQPVVICVAVALICSLTFPMLFMSGQERLLLVASPINLRQTSLSIESAVTGPGHIQTRLERDQAEGFSGWNCKTSDLKSQSESLLTRICHLCSQKKSLPASRSTTLKANKDQKKK